MTDDRLYNELRELSWRRKLTAAEEAELRAWLAAHPEAQADWEAETALNQALGRLPDVPLSSNFTARVVRTAERKRGQDSRHGRSSWSFWNLPLRWLPRVAFATVVLSLGLLSYNQVHRLERARIVESVTVVSEVASLPTADALKDFDTIQALDRTPPADEELLRLMQ